MKFAVASEHRDFFEKNKGIEFESVFSSEELDILRNGMLHGLSQRLSVSPDRITDESVERKFESGRDLWRESESLQKVICHRRLGELIYQLTGERPIRIGYDQYFPPIDKTTHRLESKYIDFIRSSISLKEMSSLQGVAGGLLVALKDTEENAPADHGQIYPTKAGNAVVLHSDGVIDWPYLLERDVSEYYLVVYAIGKCVYIRNRKDPLSGALIQLGYSAGDRLNDEKNPIIFR